MGHDADLILGNILTARLLRRFAQSVSILRLLDETYLQDLANLGLALNGSGDGPL